MNGRFSIKGTTQILCLIGHPVAHSFSPIMHNPALQELELDYVYTAFDVPPRNLEKAVEGLKALNIKGCNVTIPHKEAIIPFLDEIDPLAAKIGAINTIKNDNGTLIAKNTDSIGGKKALKEAGCTISKQKIAVIGAGGASRALNFTLAEEAREIVIFNRTVSRGKNLAKELQNKMEIKARGLSLEQKILKKELEGADILINTTPVGMYPKVDNSPISKDLLHEDLFVFDIVYNPSKTKLLKDAKSVGCDTLGGLDMLVYQGALGFKWWTGHKPNTTLMKKALKKHLGI
ncbi:MAG: shikimate dehydrogenase [Promethearchaeia archaeon]